MNQGRQQPPTMEEITEQIEMAKNVMTASLKSVSDSGEIFVYAAKSYRKLYNCLMTEGFSSEEAMEIVRNYNPLK